MKSRAAEFDEQWAASVRRAEGTPDWDRMTLDEQKLASSRIRKLASGPPERKMARLYASPGSSTRAG
ncbi:hypothetical protein SEA_SATIS_280 [Streptomyces phage Satis]|nr:hypothetical protein SEA_SATIS_280 [Streptomyces phage Satis]QBZ72166.1 hypothetical protein SEA_KRADAL_280 [Streptomyces phage Kradal]QPL14588.1 hypothetical protein SEA_EHYELIMAYOE_283 [Streptomyces phage EhyElimayoE]